MVIVLQMARKIFLIKFHRQEFDLFVSFQFFSSDVSPHKHHYYGEFNLERLSFQGLVEKVTNSY